MEVLIGSIFTATLPWTFWLALLVLCVLPMLLVVRRSTKSRPPHRSEAPRRRDGR